MSSVGKICLYCSKPISSEDRVAVCDRCYAAHHEACWERNGRCSTFRCAGMPRTMLGGDLTTVLQVAYDRANAHPQVCPFCGSKVYAGILQGKRARSRPDHPAGPGLLFVSKKRPDSRRGGLGRLLAKMAGPRSWFLPGAHIKARSCGKCRRLFLWGVPADEMFVQKSEEEPGERYCPHCGDELWAGEIALNPRTPGGARFECDEAPDFHRDWIGHNILDRYILNKWSPTIVRLPAHSCPDCQYTEIAGRPIYRFL